LEIIFKNPEYLWFLASIFLLILTYHISIGWNRKKAIKFANFDAISKATRYTLFPRSIIPLIFRIFIIVLLVLSAAGLGVWYNGYASDIDYMLVIDSSGSMLAEDYKPNRLEAAKEAATSFVDLLDADTNLGLISFAGTSFLEQELTNDKTKVREAISEIDVINVGGTAVGDALILASNTFKIRQENGRAKSIILLTDGQSNVGIQVDDSADYLVREGVVVHSLGIGTPEGGVFDESLATSQLDSDILESLASKTGGDFYLVNNAEDLKTAYLSIFSSIRTRVFFDARNYLILIALLLLIAEWLMSSTRYKTII